MGGGELTPDSGFTPLSWLRSDGNAYINTGTIFNTQNTYKIKYNALGTYAYGEAIFGGRSAVNFGQSWNDNFNLFMVTEQGNYSVLDSWDRTVGTNTNNLNQDVVVEASATTFKLNGNVVAMGNKTTNGIWPIALFGINTAGDIMFNTLPKKIYYWQVTDKNGTLVQDLIPARRNSDGVLGMYDRVTGAFLTNAGGGSFSAE